MASCDTAEAKSMPPAPLNQSIPNEPEDGAGKEMKAGQLAEYLSWHPSIGAERPSSAPTGSWNPKAPMQGLHDSSTLADLVPEDTGDGTWDSPRLAPLEADFRRAQPDPIASKDSKDEGFARMLQFFAQAWNVQERTTVDSQGFLPVSSASVRMPSGHDLDVFGSSGWPGLERELGDGSGSTGKFAQSTVSGWPNLELELTNGLGSASELAHSADVGWPSLEFDFANAGDAGKLARSPDLGWPGLERELGFCTGIAGKFATSPGSGWPGLERELGLGNGDKGGCTKSAGSGWRGLELRNGVGDASKLARSPDACWPGLARELGIGIDDAGKLAASPGTAWPGLERELGFDIGSADVCAKSASSDWPGLEHELGRGADPAGCLATSSSLRGLEFEPCHGGGDAGRLANSLGSSRRGLGCDFGHGADDADRLARSREPNWPGLELEFGHSVGDASSVDKLNPRVRMTDTLTEDEVDVTQFVPDLIVSGQDFRTRGFGTTSSSGSIPRMDGFVPTPPICNASAMHASHFERFPLGQEAEQNTFQLNHFLPKTQRPCTASSVGDGVSTVDTPRLLRFAPPHTSGDNVGGWCDRDLAFGTGDLHPLVGKLFGPFEAHPTFAHDATEDTPRLSQFLPTGATGYGFTEVPLGVGAPPLAAS